MKKEEVLKILGKTKKGRLAIGLYNKGKLALGKLKDLASKFDVISDKGVKEGLKRQGEYIDKSGKVRPLATKGFPIKKPKGKNGSNGSSKSKKKPKTSASTAEIAIAGGGTALAVPWAISKAINTGGLLNKPKPKTKKTPRSKAHMYPPPKRKRSKANMYPPKKRKM